MDTELQLNIEHCWISGKDHRHLLLFLFSGYTLF